MKRRGAAWSMAGWVALSAAQIGCNAVLGIDPASPEPDGGQPPDATVRDGMTVTTSYVVSCANYCNLIQAACTGAQALTQGDNTEYLSSDVCMQLCALMDASAEVLDPAADPKADDTLNCRVWHANAALQEDPHYHCPHAGPLGGRMCDQMADPCPSFCRMNLAICTGDNAAYASLDDCMNACEPDGGYAGYLYEVSPADTEVNDLEGWESSNTLNCRMYHLQNYLFLGDPAHCSHTSLSGGGVCVGDPPDL